MIQVFKKSVFTFSLLFFAFAIQAKVIRSVVISGATKSKKESILKWGGIRLGAKLSDEDLKEVFEKLKRAYQFNLKKVELKGETLFIDVEDKWSVFPVPMLTQSGNYYSRGLLIYENNFLGRLGTVAPGVFWTNSGINGIIYWQEDNVIAQDVGMKILLLHKSDLTEFKRRDKIVDTFETRFDTVILTPNFHKGRHDHKLGPIYIKKKVLGTSEEKLFNSESLGLFYRHHYNNYKKLPILFDGLYTSYDFFLLKNSSGDIDYLQGGDIQYVQPNSKNFFKLQVHFNQTNNSGYLSPKMLGGNEGHRGYDRESLPAQRNFGFMLQEQLYLWDNIYTAPFYEFNSTKLIKPIQNGLKMNESTVGINFSYYFKKISIPAVIIEYARNIDDKSNHIHVNLGLKL
jgi:hypothetical protein